MSILKALKKKRERAIEQQQKVAKVVHIKQRKLLETEAKPLAEELNVSMDEAIAYIQSQKKKEKRTKQFEQLKKLGKEMGESANKMSKSFEGKNSERKTKKYGINDSKVKEMLGVKKVGNVVEIK